MKIRTDILRMYKDIHGWVGIISGLALFVAFYAGAITMFEEPLQRWASPPANLAAPVPMERVPELTAAVLAAYPQAAKGYDIHVRTGPEQPARLTWSEGVRGEHGAAKTYYAALAPDGTLQVEEKGPSPVAQFVDVLHQQVGLPFDHEISMPVMGAIALLYFIAIVSGIIVLLPSLVSDLFAMRIGKNAKRMWLDLHNLLGILSLPFHLVMALTAVVFAFHDQFYDLQRATFARGGGRPPVTAGPVPQGTLLPPAALLERLHEQAPGFTPKTLSYQQRPGAPLVLRAAGSDPRYGVRAPTYGIAELDPRTGSIVNDDYMPGRQQGWGATVSSFFTLHFGSFGGTGIRWAYFLLGLAGAFLFYTGNLLWVESRRKRQRKAGAVTQTRATRILGALTAGVPLGCMAGISVSIAAAKPLGVQATAGVHSAIYYAVFVLFAGWALWRGAARASSELLPLTAGSMLLVPIATLTSLGKHPPAEMLVDLIAVVAAVALFGAWTHNRKRALHGPQDSVWAMPERAPSGMAPAHESAP